VTFLDAHPPALLPSFVAGKILTGSGAVRAAMGTDLVVSPGKDDVSFRTRVFAHAYITRR
jgi:hypothetical protein